MKRNVAVGQNIVTWRKAHHVTQSGLAETLGITRNRLWQWETEGVPAGEVALVKLALQAVTSKTVRAEMEAALVLALRRLEIEV